MFNKILLAVILFCLTTSVVFGQNVDFKKKFEKYSKIQYKVILSGDAIVGVNSDKKFRSPNRLSTISTITRDIGMFTNTINSANALYTVTFTPTGATTIYDLMSNGSPQNIFWDPNNPNNIHVVCSCSPPGDTWNTFPGRRTKYYFSTNKGTSWAFIANVPDIRSGFPTVTALSNGVALISNHSGTPNRTQWFVDQIPGLGSFITLYHPSQMDYIWPRTVATSSITQPTKFVSVASPNGRDSCFYTACGSSNLPGTFTPWTFFNSDQAETYAIARGADGRIGIAYLIDDVIQPADYGSVYYMFSTNGGISFSTPIKIFNCNFNTDSLGMLRGISMTYIANDPKIVFETIKQTHDGSYFPDAPAKIRFWSTTLPGSDPNRSVVIADTNSVGWHPCINGGNNDVLGTLCRPTIGRSADQTALFVSFMVPTDFVGGVIDSNSYNSVWFAYSLTGGLTWVPPVKITPESPLRDWTYPSISPDNYFDANYYYVYMTILSDSIPGSYISHEGNGESLARQMFVKVQIARNGTPPTAPILSSPANGATNISLNPTLDWNDVSLADLYTVQVSLSSSFATFIVNTTINNGSQYTIPSGILSISSTYYWRINAINSGGTSPWSSVWSFTTTAVAPPPAPNLVSPANNATGVSLTPLLDWDNSTGATYYTLQVSLNSAFSTTIFDLPVTPSQYNIPAGALANNTTYYWRVNAVNTSGASAWSSVWNFTTVVSVPFAPVLLLPVNGATGVSLTPFLDWFNVTSATYYHVQISLFSSFETTVFDSNFIPDSQVSVPFGRLLFFTQYFWRVCASNSVGTGPWSLVSNFRTHVTGINQISATIPTENKLFDNYPNPFNPATKIRFDIALSRNTSSGNPQAKLQIFDLLGREIDVLVNESLMPGTYEYNFNATQFPSGIYFYKLTANDYSETKRMVLVK